MSHIEDKYAQSIAIVFPSNIQAHHSLPIDTDINQHCTMTYLGEIPDASYTLDELLAVIQLFPTVSPQTVETNGLELFGQEHNFLVLLLKSDGIADTKQELINHLNKANIAIADRFPTYRPHLTLQEEYTGSLEDLSNEIVPVTVELDSPELWWGNERYSFTSE